MHQHFKLSVLGTDSFGLHTIIREQVRSTIERSSYLSIVRIKTGNNSVFATRREHVGHFDQSRVGDQAPTSRLTLSGGLDVEVTFVAWESTDRHGDGQSACQLLPHLYQ